MSMRMSADDQFKFLLSCVKWSVNGKVDFTEVAAECGVVSKGAAAKRYERMLKNHGIHPNGGPLDNSTPSKERSSGTPKVSRKRKQDEMTGSLKHDDDEEKKPPLSRRNRIAQQHEIKQEQPSMGYQPYLYSQLMPPPGAYLSRQIPPYMIPGMLHPTQAPHPPFHLMSPMPNTPQLAMPHQTQTFPMNQSLPAISQDPSSLNPFEDFCNQDFGNRTFESLLHGEQEVVQKSKASPQFETLPPSQRVRQTSIASGSDMAGNVKLGPPLFRKESSPDHKPFVEQLITPSSLHEVAKATPDGSVRGADTSTPISTLVEIAPTVATLEAPKSLKQENDSCIFITD